MQRTLLTETSSVEISLNKCLESDSLNKLKKKIGENNVKITIVLVVTEKMQLFNAKYHMTDIQIKFFSEMYLKKYGYETIHDLAACLNEAASGAFGTIYNSIDPATVFEWIIKHLDNKYQQKENLLHRKKITNLQQSENSPVNKELNKTYCKQIRQELADKKKKKKK